MGRMVLGWALALSLLAWVPSSQLSHMAGGTLTTTANTIQYSGTGTSSFPVPFKFLAQTDLVLVKTNNSTGDATTLVLTTDYTVTGAGSASGGTVTTVATVDSGYTLDITRTVPITQPTSLRSQGTFYPATHETVFDRLTMIAQQHETHLNATDSTLTAEAAAIRAEFAAADSAIIDAYTTADVAINNRITALTSPTPAAQMYNVTTYGAIASDGVSDTTAIQNAINAACAAGGGTVYFPEGIFDLATFVNVGCSNVHVQGSGMGKTTLRMMSTNNASTAKAIRFFDSTVGTTRALTLDAALGDRNVVMSAANAATFAAGDYVLVRSLRIADAASSTKFIGEIHKLLSVDSTVGVLELSGPLGESYLMSDSASVLKIGMIRNVSLSDLDVTHAASVAASIAEGAVTVRFAQNAIIERVHVYDVFYTGVDVYSCLDTTVANSRIEDVHVSSSASVYYGIWVSSASRNIILRGNYFARLRHSVTTGTHNNAAASLSTDGREGVQRGVMIIGNASYASTTAHYDTHQPAEGVQFVNNLAYGAWPEGSTLPADWSGNVFGIQARSDKTVIEGNTIQYTRGGILVFAAESKDVTITNNVIRDIQAPRSTSYITGAITTGSVTLVLASASGFTPSGNVTINGSTVAYTGVSTNTLTGVTGSVNAPAGTQVFQIGSGGHGINFDSAATGQGMLVAGNVVARTDGSCIVGNGNQTGVIVRNNLCKENSLRGSNASIKFSAPAGAIDITGNRIQDNASGAAPVDISSGDGHRIVGNSFFNNSRMNPGWSGATTLVYGNVGYHPGNTSNPWIAAGELRANVGGGGTTDPAAATTYTVGSGPCTILIRGGTITNIFVNGNTFTSTAGDYLLKMGPGDTIRIQHAGAPTTRVFWE